MGDNGYIDPALILQSLVARYGQQGVSYWTAYLSEMSRLFITAVSKLSDHQKEVVCPDEIAIVMRFPSDHTEGHCGMISASLFGVPQDPAQKEALLIRTLECLKTDGDLFPQVVVPPIAPAPAAAEVPVQPKPVETPEAEAPALAPVQTVVAPGVETVTQT